MKDLRRQLAEFTHNTQEELEQERAGLLSRNAVLEQEVTELQAYIDTHLARFVGGGKIWLIAAGLSILLVMSSRIDRDV